jgi:hypothetical protein
MQRRVYTKRYAGEAGELHRRVPVQAETGVQSAAPKAAQASRAHRLSVNEKGPSEDEP